MLNLLPGTICSIGICNAQSICEAQNSAGADTWNTLYSEFSFSGAVFWMRQNIVGTILISSSLVWIPFSLWVHRYDSRIQAAASDILKQQHSDI